MALSASRVGAVGHCALWGGALLGIYIAKARRVGTSGGLLPRKYVVKN